MGYSLMVGVRSVGDWIGDRFEIFDVHEGGMSLVYVVCDHLGKSGRTVVALKTPMQIPGAPFQSVLRGPEGHQHADRVVRFRLGCPLAATVW